MSFFKYLSVCFEAVAHEEPGSLIGGVPLMQTKTEGSDSSSSG